MTLHEKHTRWLDLVNYAETLEEHTLRRAQLDAWRTGVKDSGIILGPDAGDLHYLDQGIDRPMEDGGWLDWEPKSECTE